MASKIVPTKTNTQAGSNRGEPTRDEIAQRARAIYEESGRIPGRDVQNWLLAEKQLRESRQQSQAQRPAAVAPAPSSAQQRNR